MVKHPQTYTYNPNWNGIVDFHAWLVSHPELSFSRKVWDILRHGLVTAEDIHWDDIRENTKTPYSTHYIEMIQEYIDRYEWRITHNDILVLALHDTLEAHPERWREILHKFWPYIFRDVLVLSTWGIPLEIRREILSHLSERYKWENIIDEHHNNTNSIVMDIVRIVSPLNPFRKLHTESVYSHNTQSPEVQQIQKAIHLYAEKVLLWKKRIPLDQLMMDKEFLWLGNYCYFRPKDAKRKLQDMLHNMRDMDEMEKKKPGYIETRRIKAYILGVKLKTFGMHSEFAELEKAFQKAFQKKMHMEFAEFEKISQELELEKKSAKKANMLNHAEVSRILSEKDLILTHAMVHEMISEDTRPIGR